MIELNKCCAVEINNSKQKNGARLLTSTVGKENKNVYAFFGPHFIRQLHKKRTYGYTSVICIFLLLK